MAELAREIHSVNIESEMKQSYLDYAMSVIVGRALPDVRDGLKPVHRRVLYAMHELGNDWNKPFKKSARIVGDVIGKYHPHGDSAVYDTIVRMAQDFSLRYLLVDGQGNFGSVDGDSAAAMRYTEIRMTQFAHSLLDDLDKETVDFVPNYDGSEQIPVVLPTQVPNMLVNGSSGIAVGMATNIPPHHLGEVIDGLVAMIDRPEITIDELMEFIPGPDFPTAGIINGRAGIVQGYRTGRGRIYMRARAHIETDEKSGKEAIIVTELPYQINKARLIEKIAELVKDKRIEGISGLRDESDKDGMRIVIDIRRGEPTEVILNTLYVMTPLETAFGFNMVALVDNRPVLLNLKSLLEHFVKHRREVVTRRSVFELRKARDRAHILEGLMVALSNIDEIVSLIKKSADPKVAKQGLLARRWTSVQMQQLLERLDTDLTRPEALPAGCGLQADGYQLSEAQAQAILDLKLHRLTALEQDKMSDEYQSLLEKIKYLLAILQSEARLMEVIKEELLAIKAKFNDERRTEIISTRQDLDHEDLIESETVVVTVSQEGYVKYQPIDTYQAQRRGGRGKRATNMKDEDVIASLLVANTHDTLLCFSSFGKAYWLKVYQLPQASRQSRGRPIVNLLPFSEDENLQAILPISTFDQEKYVVMATQLGIIKKTPLKDFSRPRASGIIGLEIQNNDALVGVGLADDSSDIMLVTSGGKAIRFCGDHVRPMGRNARGVRGIKMGPSQQMIALIIVDPQAKLLMATENGYGKRTRLTDFPCHGRGGQGVIAIQTSERNGTVVGAVQVHDGDEIMLINNRGVLVRTSADEVSLIGRNAQGVTLINLSEGEKCVALQRIEDINGDNVDEDESLVTEQSNTSASAAEDASAGESNDV